MHLVLGLGGNVGNVAATFTEARSRLATWARVVESSSLYRTAPVGGVDQPEFLNAALHMELECDPGELLDRCQVLETAAGRRRSLEERWGPRPLDLDLLIVPDAVRRGPRLELPHPRLQERAFALVPAAEVAPGWVHPLLGETLERLAARALDRNPDALLGVVASNLWQV